MNNFRIMKRKEVEATTGLSRSSLYEKMGTGRFPKPIKLSTRSVGWLEHEVQQWLKDRIVETRKEATQ